MGAFLSEGEDEGTFVALVESGTGCRLFVLCAVGVDDLERSVAEHFKAVVEVSSRSQILRAKAGAWVIDLNQRNRCGGAITDGRVDERRMAARKHQKRRRHGKGEKTHALEPNSRQGLLRRERISSGKRWNKAVERSHCRLSIAG